MKLFFAILISAAALVAADPQAKKQATPPKVTDGGPPTAIPAGATQTPDGDFHYTDPKGKKWIYRKTPFGVAHLEETEGDAEAKVAAARTAAFIKATEDGDMVRFERPGPFGVWKWEKKKAELDETEKAALENARAEKASRQE